MKRVIDKVGSHGRSPYDWLDSYYILSFDGYHNLRRMSFGASRVLNDDRTTPDKGSGTYPHKNMEIITTPLKGRLQHGDSKQNHHTITPGCIQIMSVGTGIYHDETNGSNIEEVELLQIWVMPEKLSTPPVYRDYDIRSHLHKDKLVPTVSPNGNAPAKMLQQTWLFIEEVEVGKRAGYHLYQSHAGVYIFPTESEIEVNDTVLSHHNGAGAYKTNSLEVETLKDPHIPLMRVPMQGFCIK